jgi:5-formyltetrahydrofolate cyclo-ligase
MTKSDLRREMRRRLQVLGSAREEMSRAIVGAIAAHPAFIRSQRVALFAALPGEPDLESIWEAGCREFCYPRVVAEHLEFVRVTGRTDLTPSLWHPLVREPAAGDGCVVAPADVQLILVPGLAFTRDGHRLGRGGGFYDRYLSQLSAGTIKLGVCFDAQVVENLPAEAHDQRVDEVITETGRASDSR